MSILQELRERAKLLPCSRGARETCVQGGFQAFDAHRMETGRTPKTMTE
jgi:hypothetical protein